MVSDGHKLDRSAAARKRLGITAEDMEGVPRVTEKIIAGAGSISAAVTALRGDESDDAQAFIQKYDSLSESDRGRVSIEDIFTATGLTARRFIEVLTGALMQQSADVTKMILSVSQPKVTAATVKAATDSVPITARNPETGDDEVVGWTNGDVKAQEIFHKITGMLPIPKGSQTVINMQQLNQSSAKEDDDDEEELESMDSFLMGMQDVLRPQLPAPSAESVPTLMPTNAPELEYIDAEI